jgi:S-DNA-T family DNA segregation ATPase FtsK/SpoIIIE
VAELTRKATEKAAKSDLQEKIASLARLARFTGIHLVLGTQRPSKDVIHMQSKDNLPTRICFTVPSVAASTLVIGDMMASTLGGHPGRAIYQAGTSKVIQTPLLENAELDSLMKALKEKLQAQNYNRVVLQHQAHALQTKQAPEIVV